MPEIYKVYVCPECEEVHDDEDSAIECCKEADEITDRIPAAELEAAGQMRLIE